MAIPLHDRLGALRERDFRLLFTGTMITTVGDRMAAIALAFAVLDIGSATALGIIFAVGQGVQALVVVGGGVLSDRLPLCRSPPPDPRRRARHDRRHRVLHGAAGGLAGVHVPHMALGVGRLLRAREPDLRGVERPRAGDRRRAPGGAGAWATILTAGGVGAVVGSFVAICVSPRRTLVACVLFAALLSLQTLALGAPTWAIAAAAFVAGLGIAVHLTLWFTVFQQQRGSSLVLRAVPGRGDPAPCLGRHPVRVNCRSTI